MVSRVVHKRTSMFKNLQLLRSITYSRSQRKTSVLMDATEYIQSLKQKVEELNRLQAATTQKIVDNDPMPKLKVESQEESFVIKVSSSRSCQGLLVLILEAFEELGLDVLHARVSCADNFSLEAVAIKENNEDTRPLDAQSIEQVVSKAIQNWRELNNVVNDPNPTTVACFPN